MYNFYIFTIFFILIAVCNCVRYDNYTLFRAVPMTEKQLGFLKNLSEKMVVDFWREAGSLRKPVDLLIPPDTKEEFLKHAKMNRIYLSTLIPDVQAAFDKQTVSSYVRRNMHSFSWATYYRLDDIYEWMQDLAAEYPNVVKIQIIGNTEELRNIKAVRVIHKTAEVKKDRPRVIIEGGIHAREWVAISFVTYLLDRIVKAPLSSDTELKEISLHYEWYFVPILNPDGYEYSHTKDRSWRKNRGQNGFGVDLNRNFGEGFGKAGVSHTKTSPSYCGPSAFSEKESIFMRSFVNSLKHNLKFYLAFHNYGQAMIIPYAHLKEHQDNYEEVKKICLAAGRRLTAVHGKEYIVGTLLETLGYHASGVSTCWVKRTHKVPIVVLFELRDEGEIGFTLPPHLIEPTCQETLAALKVILSKSRYASRPAMQRSFKPMASGVLKKICNEAADRLFEIHHSKYAVGNSFETLGYAKSGTSVDWVKKTHNVPNVIEFELGDSGRYGLTLPSQNIIATCEETMEGIKTILRKREDTLSKRSLEEKNRIWGEVEFSKDNKSDDTKEEMGLFMKRSFGKNSATLIHYGNEYKLVMLNFALAVVYVL